MCIKSLLTKFIWSIEKKCTKITVKTFSIIFVYIGEFQKNPLQNFLHPLLCIGRKELKKIKIQVLPGGAWIKEAEAGLKNQSLMLSDFEFVYSSWLSYLSPFNFQLILP